MSKYEKALNEIAKSFKAIPIAGLLIWENSKGERGTACITDNMGERLLLIEAAKTEERYVEILREQRATERAEFDNGKHPVWDKRDNIGVG